MGVKIFYVTNRKYEYEKGTLENFKKFGIPIEGDEDSLLMRYENGWDSNKTSRRELIAKNHRVIFQIGDNLGDFVDLSLVINRQKSVLKLLPNLMICGVSIGS